MRHIKEYFNNEEVNPINGYINESFLLLALCGAVALHFTVKGMKAIRKHASNFWGWALGEKNLQTTAAESLDDRQNIINEDEEGKINKDNIQPMQVPDEKILDQLMETLKSDAKKKQGFYVFDNLFNETPELKKINKAPYFANYVVFMDPGSDENKDEKPNFYGMLGFSLKYWKIVSKKGKTDEIKEAASKLIKYINIFAVQTDTKYAKQGLFEVYLEDMKKAVKETKMEGLTIKYANDDIAKVFEKSGFKKIEGLDGYMVLTLNKPEDNGEATV